MILMAPHTPPSPYSNGPMGDVIGIDLEVVNFAASGFRDFTRIAASDPVMWRDIFLNNREAVLEMLQRFMEDAQAMARAIRWGDAAYIEDKVERGRKIRRSLIATKQA